MIRITVHRGNENVVLLVIALLDGTFVCAMHWRYVRYTLQKVAIAAECSNIMKCSQKSTYNDVQMKIEDLCK